RDCEAAQVFYKRETQGNRDGPQLTNREWRDGLISADKSLQRVCVETRVSVRDQLERNRVDTRVAFQFTVGEFWQFVVVALGEILTNFAQLFFDDVIVVDQPFGGR